MINQEDYNNVASYLRQNLPVYPAKSVINALVQAGYTKEDIFFVYQRIKGSVPAKDSVKEVEGKSSFYGGKILLITFAIIFGILGILFIVLSLSSANVKAEGFEITNVSTVDVKDSSGLSVGKVVTLKVDYKIIETKEEKSENVSVRIGEEFCIAKNSGCGIIPIAFKDKRGEEHIILTLAGRTLVNLVQKNVDWTVAEQRDDGVLFDGRFLLPNQTLGQINDVIRSDVYNNLTGVQG